MRSAWRTAGTYSRSFRRFSRFSVYCRGRCTSTRSSRPTRCAVAHPHSPLPSCPRTSSPLAFAAPSAALLPNHTSPRPGLTSRRLDTRALRPQVPRAEILDNVISDEDKLGIHIDYIKKQLESRRRASRGSGMAGEVAMRGPNPRHTPRRPQFRLQPLGSRLASSLPAII